MKIEINVTGGTNRHVRSNLIIDGELSGSIQIERANFTRICDLLFADGYSIIETSNIKQNSNVIL